jgi:hypothetical protein
MTLLVVFFHLVTCRSRPESDQIRASNLPRVYYMGFRGSHFAERAMGRVAANLPWRVNDGCPSYE